MQFGPPDSRSPRPRGAEAWLPPLLIGITNMAVVVALVVFVVIANPLRETIPVQPGVLGAALVAAGALSLILLFRAARQLRLAWRGWKERGPG